MLIRSLTYLESLYTVMLISHWPTSCLAYCSDSLVDVRFLVLDRHLFQFRYINVTVRQTDGQTDERTDGRLTIAIPR